MAPAVASTDTSKLAAHNYRVGCQFRVGADEKGKGRCACTRERKSRKGTIPILARNLHLRKARLILPISTALLRESANCRNKVPTTVKIE